KHSLSNVTLSKHWYALLANILLQLYLFFMKSSIKSFNNLLYNNSGYYWSNYNSISEMADNTTLPFTIDGAANRTRDEQAKERRNQFIKTAVKVSTPIGL